MARPATPPPWAEAVREQVATWSERNEIVGAELLIIVGDEGVLHQVWGKSDLDEGVDLIENQIFRVRSMTKPLVGTAILMLAERGELDLDDRVADHLAAFRNPRSDAITIRDLLHHTSGFTMGYPRGSIDDYEGLEEAVADAAAQGPKYEPGTEYHYADADTASLGLIVETVSGRSLAGFIREEIFTPLGMEDSYCLLGTDRPRRERVCSTSVWQGGRFVEYWDNEAEPETPFFRASGGLFCTARDYAAFLRMWLDHGRAGDRQLLSEASVAEALTPGPLFDRYGMHWELYHPATTAGGMPVFGHGGSDGTVAIALPEQDAMVLYFTQSRGTLSTMFLEKKLLQELGLIEAKELPHFPLSAEATARYAGDYAMGSETWTVSPAESGITYEVDRLVPFHFVAVAEDEFVHPILDMGIHFVCDEDGGCSSLVFRNQSREVTAQRLR
jgi:CubicO group peptidase (beta-lactamase class C family)